MLGSKHGRSITPYFFEQVRKIGLTFDTHLRHHLPHGQILFDNQLGRLAHPTIRDERNNRFAGQAFHLCIKFALAHAQERSEKRR